MTGVPVDEREVTFPSSMTAWGWLDVTKNGAQVVNLADSNPGCPDALPGKTDAASVTQTTQAIQCRLNNLGIQPNPGALYFPKGTYYINKTLSLTGYYVTTVNGVKTLVPWGQGNRSEWTGSAHISGENPATTKIVWAGDCGTDPNIADPSTVTKYNDIFYIDGISPLTIERLTLDGNNQCAGTGIDMVSKPGNMSGVSINEMNIQNLREVGIAGDRDNLTNDEIFEGDGTGMVSEVSITQVNFAHVGYACVMPNAANTVDWWIRDSSFSDCGFGIVNSSGGTGWVWPGMPVAPGLAWGNPGSGGFEAANCTFKNSRYADVAGGTSIRNSYSIASKAPFLEVYGNFMAQGNTVIASKGVLPVVSWGGTAGLAPDELTLIQNKFITQNNAPAVSVGTMVWGQSYPNSALQGASPAVGNNWDETYSTVTSIGNQYSSTQPFSTATGAQFGTDKVQGTDLPGWLPIANVPLQCGPVGATGSMIDGRTYCNFPGPNYNPVYNMLTFDDQPGATNITSTAPTLPPTRPEVARHYIIANVKEGNTVDIAAANTIALQSELKTLASNQANCNPYDYACADRWSVLFIPSGSFYVSTTIDVPASVQIQIVGTGESFLLWLPWDGTTVGTISEPILKLHAPSHVVIRDLALFGEPDKNNPNPLGEGLVAEVTDLPTSRVFSDALRMWDGFTAIGMGDAVFEMRSFGYSAPSTITGNGKTNAGYFAFFGGNPDNITVGQGENLMIQDTWYEGGESAIVTCADNDSANVTVETSNLTPGGWHGTFKTDLTSFNIGGCATKMVIMNTTLARDGYYNLAPTASIVLPASATAQTQLLTIGNTGFNSTYGNSTDVVPEDYTGSLDQGYLQVDPASKAQYADIYGLFYQSFADNYSNGDGAQLTARSTGNLQSSFIRPMLQQAVDPRQMAPSFIVTPITDMQSTDIRIERVWAAASSKALDIQFILPGATSN
jgi:hypothetical protein